MRVTRILRTWTQILYQKLLRAVTVDHEAADRKFLLCFTHEKRSKNFYYSFTVRGHCRT